MHEVRVADWYNLFSFVVRKTGYQISECKSHWGQKKPNKPKARVLLCHLLYPSYFQPVFTFCPAKVTTQGNILLNCFYLLIAAWCHLACYVPIFSTFHMCLKIMGCFLFVLLSFFEMRIEQWEGLSRSKRLPGCGHSWTVLFHCLFGNDWYRTFRCIRIYDFFFFFPKHGIIQNSSAQDEILHCWVTILSSRTCPASQMEIHC